MLSVAVNNIVNGDIISGFVVRMIIFLFSTDCFCHRCLSKMLPCAFLLIFITLLDVNDVVVEITAARTSTNMSCRCWKRDIFNKLS